MSSFSSVSNKRIARNSLIVYFRLFVTTVVGLFTSRFVLQALGVSDYGLYGVVGGIVAIFAVVSGAMSSTTIRFLNFEIGKEDGDPNKVFNICQVSHILFAVLVLILAETGGMLYILKYLKVEPGRLDDAIFIFQISTIITCIGIVNIPYQSVFIAKERFIHIAIIDIINSLVKLLCVVFLLYYGGNRLRLYAIITSLSTLFSFVAYHYLDFRFWPDLVKWKLFKNPKEYREIIVYNNYTLLSSLALMGRSQGSNMLINLFFGTLVNGAYGIARTVQGFVEVFTVNFDQAVAPQITQSVGRGDLLRASSLSHRACRFCQLLSLLIVFPLFIEMETVLNIWLGNVPEYTVSFCRIILITVFVASTGGGLLRLKDALGKIKWFMLTYSFWYFLTLPVGYLVFKHGCPPSSILVLFVITDIICRITQLVLMKVIYNYNVLQFCKEAFPRPFIVIIFMLLYALLYRHLSIHSIWMHLLGFFITFFYGTMLIWFVGIKKTERNGIIALIVTKLRSIIQT